MHWSRWGAGPWLLWGECLQTLAHSCVPLLSLPKTLLSGLCPPFPEDRSACLARTTPLPSLGQASPIDRSTSLQSLLAQHPSTPTAGWSGHGEEASPSQPSQLFLCLL